MSRCACQLLGDRLQGPVHDFHEEAARRGAEFAQQAMRYIAVLTRRRPDSVRDDMITQTQARLREIHGAARSYLPEGREMPRIYRLAHRAPVQTRRSPDVE